MAPAESTEGSSESKGPSKNELKKLAKKAEKAAKKQQSKGQGGGPPVPPTAGGGGAPAPSKATTTTATTTPVTAASPSSNKPTLLLAHASADSPATIKVVWASRVFGVALTAAAPNTNTNSSNNMSKDAKHPLLVFGDQTVSGGGNAMVQTLALMKPVTPESRISNVFGDSCAIDEWCEWERTVLRDCANDKKRSKALDTLAEHLSATATGIHLVGMADSAADICIVATLLQNTSSSTDSTAVWPAAVNKYVHAHQASYDAALASVPDYTPPAPAAPAKPIDMDDPSLLKVLGQVFGGILSTLYPDIVVPPASLVARCSNPKHGDYQCTAAMPVFSHLKKAGALGDLQNPHQVAAVITAAIGDNHALVTDLSINGPGFIMCRVQTAHLQHHVNILLRSKQLPKPAGLAKQTCVVDFSSPNIAKEMHVGHLRSTIIGEAVCRILEFCGHNVNRVNHVGDWGTQFGMLIQYLKEEYPEVGQEGAELPNITDLTVFYKAAKGRFDDNPDFKKTAQTNVVKLQSGDAECLQIWKMLCDVSRREFQKVYNRLDVTTHECGESFYNTKIVPVIKEFDAAGKISVEEGGAKCVFIDKFKVPLMLQKSDGGYGYDSTDMAALKYRLQTLKADRIIVITDFSQGDHFKMVYAAGKDIGWLDNGQSLEHIGFGTVQGEDGKRFKTRSGDTVRLVDLLDEAVNRMEGQLKGRIEEGKANITLDEVHQVAESIGYGAIKYYDLRRNPTSNYQFSYDQMLSTKGNTAVYLLYARVRLESIAAKAKKEFNVDVEELWKAGEEIVLGHPSERNLALYLQQFPDTIETTLVDLFPYHICEYVYNLANASSDFVTQCKVLGSPEMNSRLLLCLATTTAMHQCFDLLGIRHVKRI